MLMFSEVTGINFSMTSLRVQLFDTQDLV